MLIPVDNSHNINVTYTNKAAHINNDSLLGVALRDSGSYNVASAVKTYYQRTYGTSLNVSQASMALEIVGHYYPDKALNIVVNSSVVPEAMKTECRKILKSTSVIDSGESSVDGNRWIWDALTAITSVYNPIISLAKI